MAKVKKDTRIRGYKDIKGKIKPWLENKIASARKVSKPRAARAIGRFGAPAGVALLALIVLYSLTLPKNRFQLAKERLIKNPNDLEAHLILAEEYLNNNKIEEAEKELLLAQRNYEFGIMNSKPRSQVLGGESSLRWEELWQRKKEANPEDIRKLIQFWEKILSERGNYRDGCLQLAFLHYKLFENKKAKEHLERALELDPNFQPARELERILGD